MNTNELTMWEIKELIGLVQNFGFSDEEWEQPKSSDTKKYTLLDKLYLAEANLKTKEEKPCSY